MPYLVILEYDAEYTGTHQLSMVVSSTINSLITALDAKEELPELNIEYGHSDTTGTSVTLISSTEISQSVADQISCLNRGYAQEYLKQLEEYPNTFGYYGESKTVLIIGDLPFGEKIYLEGYGEVQSKDFIKISSSEVKRLMSECDHVYWTNPILDKFMKYYPVCPIIPEYFRKGAIYNSEDETYILLKSDSSDSTIFSEEEALKIFEVANSNRDPSQFYVFFSETGKYLSYLECVPQTKKPSANLGFAMPN